MQREDFEVPLTSAPLPRHMLFLGTKEYPEENSFESFLVANSGSQNAFTSAAWLKDAGSNRSSVRQLVEHFRSSCAVMLWWYVMDEAGSLLASVCLSFFLSLPLSLSLQISFCCAAILVALLVRCPPAHSHESTKCECSAVWGRSRNSPALQPASRNRAQLTSLRFPRASCPNRS